jgi:hypothetical protein
MYNHICIKCGLPFQTEKKNKKYCSRKCRYLYRNKISYYKNRERILSRLKTKQARKRQNLYNKRPERLKWHRDYLREKRRIDPKWKIKLSIVDRIRIDKRFTGQSRRNIEQYLDNSLHEILDHLLSGKYNLKDFLNPKKKLEIDHIILHSSYEMFQLGDKEFRKCWNKENLRLITKKANRNRSQDRLDWKLIKELNISHLLPEDPLITFNRIKENI